MILFSHVLKEYLRFVLGTIILCVFLFVLFDFMHKTTKYFPAYRPGGLVIAQYYFYQLPYQIVQALPIASLLGSVLSMLILSRGNEITVMRASGMSPFRIGLPLAAGGMAISLFSLAVGELVIPFSSKRMHIVQDISIEKEDDDAIDEGVRWLRGRNRLFHFQRFDPETTSLEMVTLFKIDRSFSLLETIQAKVAKFLPERGNWLLSDVKVYSFFRSGALRSLKKLDNLTMFLPIDPGKMQRERRLPAEMAAGELYQVIRAGKQAGKDILKERIAWHLKWAYPFAAFFVSLMGFKFAFRSERSNESVRKVLMAFLLGISYWFILSTAKALGSRGDISPMLAAWSANIIIFLITVIQVYRVRRA